MVTVVVGLTVGNNDLTALSDFQTLLLLSPFPWVTCSWQQKVYSQGGESCLEALEKYKIKAFLFNITRAASVA